LKKLFLFGFVVLILGSCATPESTVRKKEQLPVERILKRLEAKRRKIRTFEATGVVKIQSPKFDGKANVQILIKRPDSLKVSLFGPFGMEIAEGLITRKGFLFYDALKNKVFYGKNNRKILKRIFKLDVSLETLTDALIGSKNLTDVLYNKPAELSLEKEKLRLTFENKNNKEVFVIDKNKPQLLTYKLFSDKKKILEEYFDNFRKIKGTSIPQNIGLVYKTVTRLNLDYRNIRLNEKIESLKIRVPTDAKRLRW